MMKAILHIYNILVKETHFLNLHSFSFMFSFFLLFENRRQSNWFQQVRENSGDIRFYERCYSVHKKGTKILLQFSRWPTGLKVIIISSKKYFSVSPVSMNWKINQTDSMLPYVCSVIDQRWRQNVLKTEKWHTSRWRVCHWCTSLLTINVTDLLWKVTTDRKKVKRTGETFFFLVSISPRVDLLQLPSLVRDQSINQSFILARYVEELKKLLQNTKVYK